VKQLNVQQTQSAPGTSLPRPTIYAVGPESKNCGAEFSEKSGYNIFKCVICKIYGTDVHLLLTRHFIYSFLRFTGLVMNSWHMVAKICTVEKYIFDNCYSEQENVRFCFHFVKRAKYKKKMGKFKIKAVDFNRSTLSD
jgi:hypothetical protein